MVPPSRPSPIEVGFECFMPGLKETVKRSTRGHSHQGRVDGCVARDLP
jgi:hypothetical protein